VPVAFEPPVTDVSVACHGFAGETRRSVGVRVAELLVREGLPGQGRGSGEPPPTGARAPMKPSAAFPLALTAFTAQPSLTVGPQDATPG